MDTIDIGLGDVNHPASILISLDEVGSPHSRQPRRTPIPSGSIRSHFHKIDRLDRYIYRPRRYIQIPQNSTVNKIVGVRGGVLKLKHYNILWDKFNKNLHLQFQFYTYNELSLELGQR